MRKIKTTFLLIMALIMSMVCSIGLTGCIEDIKKLELNIEIYDYEEKTDIEEYTMTIDLYRHLAPKTVDAIVKYVGEGYYDGAIFYKMTAHSSQYMLGDLLFSESATETQGIVKNDVKPGEFEYGGTVGSNLVNKKGSIGLWRSWYALDGGYQNNRNATDTGSATWYMPTSSIASYDKYFCVFAQYDVNSDANEETLTALSTAFLADNCENYVIYYTGEYDNLTFNCVRESKFNKDAIEDLFVAEGTELACYNYYTISVPVTANGVIGAKIVSAKIV